MITVKATREGLSGKKTATGYPIDDHVPFVALPSPEALRQMVTVINPRTGLSCKAFVLDVGPWNIRDNAYVFQAATLTDDPILPANIKRPQAESGADMTGRTTNGAGIDLGEFVWKALGMTNNDLVSWKFNV